MTQAHAFLAPSSAGRWVECPGSASMEARYPETEADPAAADGTAAHWVVERLLRDLPVALNDLAPNGVPIDADMLEAGHMVYEDVTAVLGANWRKHVVLERRVNMPRIHPSANWGTPDVRGWAPDPETGRWALHVWDFKYGHKLVEVYENWQLIDYVSGCLTEANIDGLTDQVTDVTMHVIQPRAYHKNGPIRRWKVKAALLRAYFNRLEGAATEATKLNPPCRPSPPACENCRARHACEALQRAAYRAADMAQAATPLDMPPDALGLELRQLKRAKALLEARESGLEAQAAALIRSGTAVAWFAMESSPGRRVWTRPPAEIIALGQMFGADLAAPVDVITPTQALKRAPVLESLLPVYSSRPVGAAKLVPDDGTTARRVFTA